MATTTSIITTARYIILDVNAEYRQSDDELISYLNDGIREISALRSELFATVGDMVCTPSQCEQVVTFSDAQAILQALCIHNGAALTMFDMAAMDAFNPGWRADTPAAATSWSKFTGDPLRFYVYPPAPATTQTLDILYTRVPTVLALGDTISEIPAALLPALVDYIVYRAESKDDEHTNSNRAGNHLQSFLAKVKGA